MGMACLMAVPAFAQAQEIPEYCLENEVTHRYLTEVQYRDGDYTYTKITDYYQLPTAYRKDQPAPVSLQWEQDGTFESQCIRLWEEEDTACLREISLSGTALSCDIYNLVPGRTYRYEVSGTPAESDAETFASGLFRTTGTVRMLKVDGVHNVRDLGGWTAFDGRKVPYGKLIRGGRLRANSSNTVVVEEAGKEVLLGEGIGLEIDLRTDSEANSNNTSPLGSGVRYVRYKDAWACRIVTFQDNSTAVSAMQNIISSLKQGKGTYFHCSVGADRTGTVAFLALALLGVGEDALSKDFELSSFYVNPDEEMLRMRTSDRYDYQGMMKKIYALSGSNLQMKVYNYFKNGISGTKISESDLDWYINYMIGFQPVTSISADVTSLKMECGQEHQLVAKVLPENAEATQITFVSSNEAVATVSGTGLVTAHRGGSATVSIIVNDRMKGEIKKNVTVSVPLVETVMPDTIFDGDKVYLPKTNLIKNGSFEYAGHFTNWTNVKKLPLLAANFDVKAYSADSNDVYIQSKSDTDAGSIRTMWNITKGRTYVFGYKVRNTSGNSVNHNKNLETSLVNLTTPIIEGEGDDFIWDDVPLQSQTRGSLKDTVSVTSEKLVFEYPSYDGQWTDVFYVFTNTDGYKYLQVLFSNLSQNGDNTCLDSFFLTEVSDITAVRGINRDGGIGLYHNLSGQEIAAPGKGFYIHNGKKYYNK